MVQEYGKQKQGGFGKMRVMMLKFQCWPAAAVPCKSEKPNAS